MRQIVFFAVVIGLALVAMRVTDARHSGGAAAGGMAASVPQGTPPEIAGIVTSLDEARGSAVKGIGSGLLRREAATAPASGAAGSPAEPFADAGPPRRIRRVRRAVRRDLRDSSGAGVRLHVMAWQGVIVVGGRAAVRADVERIVATRSGAMALPPTRMTLGLLARGGWHVVSTEQPGATP